MFMLKDLHVGLLFWVSLVSLLSNFKSSLCFGLHIEMLWMVFLL